VSREADQHQSLRTAAEPGQRAYEAYVRAWSHISFPPFSNQSDEERVAWAAVEAALLSDLSASRAENERLKAALGPTGQNEAFDAFTILNEQGQIWTRHIFQSEEAARKHYAGRGVDKHTVSPVRVVLTLPATSSGDVG
jgi:hypothetical protein